jgi:hypothetical protein
MAGANVSDEPIRSEITDALDRMREERLSRKSKQSELDEAGVNGPKSDSLPSKRP